MDMAAGQVGPLHGFRLHPNFILRPEYFGALLLSRSEGTRYVLDATDGYLVWALNQGLSIDDSLKLVRSIDESFAPKGAVARLFAKGVLVQAEASVPLSSEQFRELSLRIDRAASRDYLSAPLNVSFYPFMACQMRCSFCYVTTEKWSAGYRTAGDWIRLAEEAYSIGVPTISLLGGDPSLYPEIVPLIEGLDAIGITGVITTNGCNVKPSLLDAMVESESLIVSASLQSVDDDYHSRMTGRPVSETMNFVRRLEARSRRYTINSVYIGQTDAQVLELIEFAIDHGASKLSLAVFVDIAQTGMVPPTFSEYRRIYELGMEFVSGRGSDLVFQVEGCQLYTAYGDFEGDPLATEFERLIYGCEAGNARFEVMHDGTALPCALFEQSTWSAGNVFDDGLARVWDESTVMRRIRTYKNNDPSCSGCKFGNFCNGGCPALNESRYGSIEGVADDRCQIRLPAGVSNPTHAMARSTRPMRKVPVTIGHRPTP